MTRVQGAEVSRSQDGRQLAATRSDAFGDFRFDGLPRNGGVYRADVRHAQGGAWRECTLGESVYLGEMTLVGAEEVLEAGGDGRQFAGGLSSGIGRVGPAFPDARRSEALT